MVNNIFGIIGWQQLGDGCLDSLSVLPHVIGILSLRNYTGRYFSNHRHIYGPTGGPWTFAIVV